MLNEIPVFAKQGKKLVFRGTIDRRTVRKARHAVKAALKAVVDFVAPEPMLPPRFALATIPPRRPLETRRMLRYWEEHDCSWKRQSKRTRQYRGR
jgi:hypothetical protein